MAQLTKVSAALSAVAACAASISGVSPLTPQFRDKLNELYQESSKISGTSNISLEEFRLLLRQAHNLVVTCDSIVRSVIIRLVRLSMKDSNYCECAVEEEFHWLLVMSLERDHEYVQERMQALKCMRRFIEISPKTFPMGLARSLVAVANNKDDNIRRVCLETLRELAVLNPEVVVRANGLSSLLDAVIEPNTQDMSESILLSILYLLNDPKSRIYLRPYLDLRVLLAPFTDLDCEDADLVLKCKASKAAMVTMLRTWVGVVFLASDSLGLSSVIGMLRDANVSTEVQSIILDVFNEVLEPMVSSVVRGRAATNESGMDVFAVALENPVPTPGETIVEAGKPAVLGKGSEGKSGFSLFTRASQQISSGSSSFPFSPNRKRTSTSGAINPSQGSERSSLNSRSMDSKSLDFDPLFNGLDNYATLVCCACIHCGLIDSLCCLGTMGSASISKKARLLLLSLLRVISRIFPEKYCSELLTLPGLIELSTTGSSLWSGNTVSASASYRASQILLSVASVFSSNLPSLPMHQQSRAKASNGSGVPAVNSSASSVGSVSSKYIPPNTVRSIRDLVLEMKASSSTAQAMQYNSRNLTSKLSLLDELNSKLHAGVDRNEFKKQMDCSRVLGKEGKEPFRWDWEVISEMIKYSFSDSDRLAEALETKWVKRVSGFYRCTADEKGYFANLEWDPSNLFYLECACDLYSVLVSFDNGVSFLGSDRRGMLFIEMAAELEQLVSNDKGWVGYGGPKNMFRIVSVSQFMVREFFTLVGRMCASKPGRKLLDSTSVFNHLSCLGSYKQLDYLSRIVITGLSFTDRGFLSQNLIQIWTSSDNCSHSLRSYIHALMLALLRSHPEEFLRWGVNVVCNQLLLEEIPSDPLVKVIEEAVQDPTTLRAFIQKRPNIQILPSDSSIPIRMLSVAEGLDYLSSKNILQPMLENWTQKCSEYPLQIERSIFSVFSKDLNSSLHPITVPSVDTSGLRISEYGKGSEGNSSFVLAGEAVDLEGLLRIPWGIEVKLTTQSSQPSNTEYLRIDTYLDASNLSSSANCSFITERDRKVVVRGIVLDGRGLPTAHPIAANKILQCCLLAGVCSVNRKGVVGSSAGNEYRAQRRKSTTTNNTGPNSYASRETMSGRSRGSTAGEPSDEVPPVSASVNDQSFDWSFCKPNHRHGNVIKLKDGKFAIEVPGEPVRWIFSKSLPGAPLSAVIEEHGDGSNRVDASRTGGFLYLLEVQYYIQLDTGLPKFVSIPRHLFGEISKTAAGLKYLRDGGMIETLIQTAKDDNRNCLQRRAALWSLGHIGVSDIGCEELISSDPSFIEWCTNCCCNSSNFALRSTAFHALGLIGRSKQGMRSLQNLQWEVSPFFSNSAVAYPRDPGQLFQRDIDAEMHGELDITENDISLSNSSLKPFSTALSPDLEVLNLIAKMPGVILYAESKNRLEALRSQHPEIFDRRDLYIAVLNMLERMTFKLSARKDILNLFSVHAKMRIV